MTPISCKRLLAAIVAFAGGLGIAVAADRSWNGRISDSMCGGSHMIEPDASGRKMSEGECVRSCVKDGSAFVFVSDGKVIPIDNQDFPTLGESAGLDVTLYGTASKNSIRVSRIVVRK